LVHHGVDGVFELEDFSADVDGDLAGKLSFGDRCGDFRDIADLTGQVAGHEIDVVGQVFPGTSNTSDLCLSTKLSFRPYLTGHTCHLRSERTKLIDHRVNCIFQLQNFPAYVNRDLF
jgi:hypothetical protein